MTLKEWRREKRYSQREAGEMIGVSCMTISRWERGVTTPQPENMTAIYAATKGRVRPQDFYPDLGRS